MKKSVLNLRFAVIIVALILCTFAGWRALVPRSIQLRIATGSQNGLYYKLAKKIALAVSAEHPEITIEWEESSGSKENLQRLSENQTELALLQNDGVGDDSVRSLAGLYPEVLHLIGRVDSNITSLADLRGKKVVVGGKDSGTYPVTTKLLEFAGLQNKFVGIEEGFAVAKQMLEAGQADAAFFLVGIGSEVVEDLMRQKKFAFIPIQITNSNIDAQSAAEAFVAGFQLHYPNVSPHTIPMLAYNQRPANAVPTLSVRAVLACHKTVPDEVAEAIVRTLFAKRAILAQDESAFSHLNEQAAQQALKFPLHTGAESFYRRREPGFLTQHAEAMGFVVSILLLGWSALQWIRREYSQNRKDNIDKLYNQLSSLLQRARDCKDQIAAQALVDELWAIEQHATQSLVDEDFDANEAFLIYQNMHVNCQEVLRHIAHKLEVSESPS